MASIRQAFAVVPAKDYQRARAWYEEKLGIVPTVEFGFGGAYFLDGTSAEWLSGALRA